MGRAEVEEPTRHSVVPAGARRSPWLAAIWTGLGSAAVCLTAAIVAVAVCWLPASSDGHTTSAIRAGLLTFLAGLHGGVTVDGVSTTWLPLGMLGIIALTAWRAGSGLADAAQVMGERDPLRLALAGLAQALTFTVGALAAVPFATLGTSRAPFLGVGVAAFLVFLCSGGVAFARASALREVITARLPGATGPVLRAAAGGVASYLGAGALLAAGSLVVHHAQAQQISTQLGSGLAGLPIAVLGVLAAPNAAIAGVAYLAGPGFAVGSGTTFSLFGTAHGVVPAFPILAALPSGPGTSGVVWSAAGVTALLSGLVLARVSARAGGWPARFATAGCAAIAAGALMFLLAWQGGGAVGDDRLATVGASPWQVGGAVALTLAVTSGAFLGLGAVWSLIGSRDVDDELDEPILPPVRRTPRMVVVAAGEGAVPTVEESGQANGNAGRPGRDDPLAG